MTAREQELAEASLARRVEKVTREIGREPDIGWQGGYVAGYLAARAEVESLTSQLQAAQATIERYSGHVFSWINEYGTTVEYDQARQDLTEADTSAHDAAILAAVKADDEFPWAVENRVVKGPIIALFRDHGEADEYVDNFVDLRVIRYQPEAEQ